MPRVSNKENTAALDADLGPSLHSLAKHTATAPSTRSVVKTKASLRGGDASKNASVANVKSTKRHKRALEQSDENVPANSLVDKAKQAIKRRCTEMGIRKYASLSSISVKHAHATCEKQDKRGNGLLRKPPAHDHLDAKDADPSSEATIVLLPSEYDIQEEAEDGSGDDGNSKGEACIGQRYKDTLLDESSLLESQITLVAPSSPFRLAPHDVADSSILLSSEIHDMFEPAIQELTPPAEDFPDTCEDLADWLLDIEREYALGLDRGIARHPELSGRMRPILVDWLMEVAADYRMHRQTLHLTVQYLDRFLAHTPLQVQPSMLQCYGTACLSVAMKMEEKHAPSLNELTDFSKDAFTCDELKQAELDVLEALDWHLAVPTAFEFLCLAFQRAALHFPALFADSTMPDEPKAEWHPSSSPASVPRRFDARQFISACDYVDALLHNQGSLRFSASEVAAACFYLSTSSSSLDGMMFALCTGYSFVDVFPTILHVKRLKAKLDPSSTSLL
ncbi:G1/S-specific cyclin-E1, partial [Coemansia sp. RSA 1933]